MLTVRASTGCRVYLFLMAAAILPFFIGLPDSVAGDAAPAAPEAGKNQRAVVLLPFKDMVAIYGPSGNIRSPLNGRIFLSGPVEEKAAGFLDVSLQTLLFEKDAYALVATERAGDMLAALANQQPPLAERDLWVKVGRALGADAVLGGFVYRFRDRTGQDYGVDEAASVAFDLHLVRVLDGRIQWSGRVDETQQPLSDNLYDIKKFLSRGGKWVTSREMALGGLKSLIADMPGR